MIIREYELHSILKNNIETESLHMSNVVEDFPMCHLKERGVEYLSGQYNIKVKDLINNYSLKFFLMDNSVIYFKINHTPYTNYNSSKPHSCINIQLFDNYFIKLNKKIRSITLECTENISQLDTIYLIPLESIRSGYLLPSNLTIKYILKGTIINSTVLNLNITVKLRDGTIKGIKLQQPFKNFNIGKIGKSTKIQILYKLAPNLAKYKLKINSELLSYNSYKRMSNRGIESLFSVFYIFQKFMKFKMMSLILEGHSGVRKNKLLNQLGECFNLTQIKINLYNLTKGGGEIHKLKSLFNERVRKQPNLFILDNLEILFPPGCDRKLVAVYLDLISSLQNCNDKHILIATTTNANKVDETILNTFLIKFKLYPYKIKLDTKFSNDIKNIESINWGDIGGLEGVKASLKECITCTYTKPETLKRLNISPTRGILLYGPPGGGKTLLAKAIATEYSANFISLSIPSLIQCEVGESEKTLTQTFHRAKLFGPSVIFLDEIECAFVTRNLEELATGSLISQLALELDELKYSSGVIVLAATNYPSNIDQSLLRSGRIDKLFYIPPPDVEGRKSIIFTSLNTRLISDDVNIQLIAHKTDHFSGADLRILVNRAALCAYKRVKIAQTKGQGVEVRLNNKDFEEALKVIAPTTNILDIVRLKTFSNNTSL